MFAADGVHPYAETGHELYLQAIVRSWKRIAEVPKPAHAHTVNSPMLANNYEHAMMVPITEATLSPGFVPLDPGTDEVARIFAAKLPSLRRGMHPGDSVTFRFKGTCAAILDVIGPDTSQVIVTLDHQPARVVPRFDFFCSYGYRLAVVPIGTDLPDTIHTVKVEIDREQPDRMKIMGDRARSLERPERFQGTNFYPGSILLVGEVAK